MNGREMYKKKNKRIPFLNTYIDNLTMEEAVAVVMALSEGNDNHYVVTPNADHIVRLEKDEEFQKVYQNADLILADGKPLIWLSRLLGTPIKEKVSGSDLFPAVCERAAGEGKSMFFLGAAPGVAAGAARRLQERYPGLEVAGTYSPSYGFEKDRKEIAHIVETLNQKRIDILCLGLGTPKQEKFFCHMRNVLHVGVALNIGAAIDFEAGNMKRAPVWMQGCGLEWLYRLMQEPRRLFKRYLIDDMKIIGIAWKYRKRHEDSD